MPTAMMALIDTARHVGQVVDAEEAVVQQAHQHEQDSEADKRQDRRVMQQFFPALAEAGAGGAAPRRVVQFRS